MTTEKQKNISEYPDQGQIQENTPDIPAEEELFTDRVSEADSKADDLFSGAQEELSVQEVFVGDNDFYNYLTDIAKPAKIEKPAVTSLPEVKPIPLKRFSTVQIVLAAGIIVISLMLLYTLASHRTNSPLKSPSEPLVSQPPAPLPQQISPPEPSVAEAIVTTPQQVQKTQFVPDATQPLSLNVAQNFYLNGDYAQALGVYEKLRQNLSSRPREDLMRDFLQMQIALCVEKTGDHEQANRLFRNISQSRSPLVRVIANYHRSLLEMQRKQYLNARTKTYQAIALIDTVDFDKDWALSLKRNCSFLAAEAVTRKVLWLRDADNDLPESSWGDFEKITDPLVKLNETQLRTILNFGSEQLNKVVLSPQVRQLDQSRPARYDVSCNGASVEELLTKFAANAGLDIHWALEPTKIGIRKRAVSLHMPAATTQQCLTVAAGCAGLLAKLNEKGIVDIFNPTETSYVSEQISLLSAEAVSLWQKFLLGFPEDTRLSNAHFALGLLQDQQGLSAEPIAEYKLVANRFSSSSMAPLALLNSSKIKNSLRDYSGARQDLQQLVEQYPDTEIAGEAYLCLADSTAKAGFVAEAARLYGKVYNLGLSAESETTAAIEAGKCFYQMKDYESAEKWLTRYVSLVKNEQNKDLYSAYFFLGKTYLALGNPEAACEAFQYALQGGPSRLAREEYMETISALVEGYIQQGNFVQSLDVLEDIHSATLSQKESIAILLLKSKVLRAIGLVDNAIAILGDSAEFIPDPQLQAKVYLELADCYIDEENFEPAREKLSEILVDIEPGPLAHEIVLKLAGVCLKLGRNSQVESVCLQLLDMEPPEQTRQKALNLLATAYNQQRNFDKAALALLGQWK